MNCNQCGKLLPDGSEYCTNCGAALYVKKENTAFPIRLVTGLLFVVTGTALLLLPNLLTWLASASGTAMLALMGSSYLSAHSMMLGFCSLGDNVYPVIGLFSVVAGFALLTDRAGAGFAAVLAAVLQIFALLHPVVTQLLLWFTPDLLAFIGMDSMVKAAGHLLSNGSIFSWWYVAAGLFQLLSFAVAVTCVVLLIVKRKKKLFKVPCRGLLALLVAIPAYCLLNTARQILPVLVYVQAYGDSGWQGWSAAVGLLKELPVLPVLVCLLVCMLLWKKNYLLPAGPLVLLAVIGCSVATVIAVIRSKFGQYPAEIVGYMDVALIWRGLGMCVLQTGLVLWVAASARGSIPVWAQIPISILLPLTYIALELLKTFLLGMRFYLPMGELGAGLLLGGAAVILVLLCKSDIKRERAKLMT